MSPPRESELPRQSDGFRIVRELGRGGMGVVYEAHELDSGRVVALKVLAAELSVSGEAFERFRREAGLAAAISDARCVFVYGAHQVDGSPAIAMELVGGETLQDKITRGDSIAIETAVRWAIDVIDGLEAAHQNGIIHRDVKPSNCFVTPDGRVKIGDFGLSRTLERDIELTQSGQFLGSPLYASPEQIRGRTVDARSDQYSCAATLYALLTGRAPFGGNNVGEVLARILSEAPPRMRSIRPELPSELERVVRRGMERDPAKRFRDLDAFRAALLPFSSQEAAAGPIPRRLGAWIVDAMLLAFLNGGIGTYLQASHDVLRAEVGREIVTMPLALQFAMGMIPIAYFAISEAFFARTLGKWLFGLQIASVGPGAALWVRVLPRAALFELPALVLLVPFHYIPQDQMTALILTPVYFLVLFVGRTATMRRRNGWRGPHELLTRTRVVQASLPFRRLRPTVPPPESAAERGPDVPERLGGYQVLGVVGRTSSGPLLHARDERLERSVWIQIRDGGATTSEARRGISRPNRLRWLETLRARDEVADVFESPGGAGLAQLETLDPPPAWPVVERALSALAEELARSESESGGPLTWSPNQVWIDRRWNVRLLDEPVPAAACDHDALGLLGRTATALLGTRPGRELPADLPLHAEKLVRALTGTGPALGSLAEARAEIASCQASAPTVERQTRSAQLSISTLLVVLFGGFTLLMALVLADFFPHMIEMRASLRELAADRVAVSKSELSATGSSPSGPALDDETRRWRQLVLAYESALGLARGAVTSLPEDDRRVIDEAVAAVPKPTKAEFEDVRARITAQRGTDFDMAEIPFIGMSTTAITYFVAALISAGWLLAAFFSGLAWPGGLSFRLFGLSVRRPGGQRAGRAFGLLRTFAFGLPLVAGYAVAAGLALSIPWAGNVLFGLTAALHLAGIVATLADPSRGPIDRVLGSRIVPR